MRQKVVYPYDYMDSFAKFNEKELPRSEDFYSLLNDTHISEREYEHAQNVWKTFSLRDMGEYHDLYLRSDIILLADVFQNFKKTCLLLWLRSMSLLYFTRTRLGCYVEDDWSKARIN